MADELKTKPTQHSVRTLLSLGIQPDILICRAEKPLPQEIKKKIALFTNVKENLVISAPDLDTIYALPLEFARQSLNQALVESLDLQKNKLDILQWENMLEKLESIKNQPDVSTINIAFVGKYIGLKDAYKSLIEAFKHAQIATNIKLAIEWIDSETITEHNVASYLKDCHGILVPGGFGGRGIHGKIQAVTFARKHNIPFFGICLGMQIAAIEFGRNVLHLNNAHSTEFDPTTENPVIDMLQEQKTVNYKGGTMRLGSQTITIAKNSLAYAIYQQEYIEERHRHRYEFNPHYKEMYLKAGFIVSGISKDGFAEIIEIPEHPFFIASQFHPEFKSKIFVGHPLFVAFIKAAFTYKNQPKCSNA